MLVVVLIIEKPCLVRVLPASLRFFEGGGISGSMFRPLFYAAASTFRVARKLGLFPQPTGTGPDLWQARCPGAGHPLYVNAEVNEFGCGWCRCKGGVKDLRVFVNERKKGIK